MAQTNFRAIDFKPSDKMKAAKSTRDGRGRRLSEPEPTTKALPQPDKNPDDVPAGTVPEVLNWVGEDVERAQKALDLELEDAKPRKGLVSALTGLIDSETDDDAKNADED